MKLEDIIKAYNDGQSLNAIARECHTQATTISRLLERNGVELRHDFIKKGTICVEDNGELLTWAKAQGRLVTKDELALVIGKKKLSHSYFLKYPELGQYIKPRTQKFLIKYANKLYDCLREYNIPYKPNDRTKLKGISVDALLLGDYSNIVVVIGEKAPFVSRKEYTQSLMEKQVRAGMLGVKLLILNAEQLRNFSGIKEKLDELKNKKEEE